MKEQTVACKECGQRGDRPPGFTLGEYPNLAAVAVTNAGMTGFEDVPTPQRLTCNACGTTTAVPRGSVEVRER